jgi:hypothetical protein
MDIQSYLSDLKQIERILLSCYGKNGKSALIQSTSNSSETASFMLTNDAMTILSSMKFQDNQVLILLIETIRKHSVTSGDNCKTLFIYVLTFLTNLFESSSNKEEVHNFISFIKKTNLVFVYEEFLNQWNSTLNNQNSSTFKVGTIEDFLSMMSNLSVLNDLNGLNRTLSSISSNLICSLIKNYFLSESNTFNEIPNILHALLRDLDHTLVYSDKFTTDRSRVFENGFLLNNKVLINHFENNEINNGIFLLVPRDEPSDVHIEIKSNFEENILNSFYAQKKSIFSAKFLEKLKVNNVNVVFTSGCLSELQKFQLNSQNISLVSYLNEDLIRFICNKLEKEPLEIVSINSDDFDEAILKSNYIALESIEIIENETLTHFKVSEKKNLNFVYFCSPIKLQFGQFKTHLYKVIKTLLCTFEELNLLDMAKNQNLSHLFVKTLFFETTSLKIFETLKNLNTQSTEKFLFYKYLIKIFDLLIAKLSGHKIILYQETAEKQYTLYEPIALKFNCFIKSLYFIQSILKIDKIFFVKKA